MPANGLIAIDRRWVRVMFGRGGQTNVRKHGRLARLVRSASAVACSSSERSGGGISFVNHTDEILTITSLNATGEEASEPILHALAPGSTVVVNDRFMVNACGDVTLIARATDGNEVARRPGPICAPGEWVIEAGARPSPSI